MDFLTGYAVFHWIATWANPFCDVVFRTATDLGYPTFYYLTIAVLFWVVDRRRAGVLFLLVVASAYVNTFAKLWVHTPRPDPSLARVLDLRPYQSGSNAFPSGHAQNAVVFWAYLAWWVGRRWFSVLAGSLVLLISFSRLYLGVHFPIDVIGGLAIGIVLMLALLPVFERWSQSGFRLGAGGALPLAGGSLVLTMVTADPTVATISGSLLGFLVGAVWLPQSALAFSTLRQASAAVTGGLLILGGLSASLESLPHEPLTVYTQVAALWIIALWVYPQALRRVWPSPLEAR